MEALLKTILEGSATLTLVAVAIWILVQAYRAGTTVRGPERAPGERLSDGGSHTTTAIHLGMVEGKMDTLAKATEQNTKVTTDVVAEFEKLTETLARVDHSLQQFTSNLAVHDQRVSDFDTIARDLVTNLHAHDHRVDRFYEALTAHQANVSAAIERLAKGRRRADYEEPRPPKG